MQHAWGKLELLTKFEKEIVKKQATWGISANMR
jgi:hypothetical protein